MPTVRDTPNIFNIFINIGHRFGQQSGLYKNSRRNSTAFRHRNAFRVYLVFSKKGKNTKYDQKSMFATKTDLFEKKVVSFSEEKKTPAAACDSAKLKGYKHKYELFDI